MARDFKAASQLGTDDKHITSVDGESAALVAVQGWNQKAEADTRLKHAEIAELKRELGELGQPNALRHSCASYRFAQIGDPGRVAGQGDKA